jgi:hypothetical protein
MSVAEASCHLIVGIYLFIAALGVVWQTVFVNEEEKVYVAVCFL